MSNFLIFKHWQSIQIFKIALTNKTHLCATVPALPRGHQSGPLAQEWGGHLQIVLLNTPLSHEAFPVASEELLLLLTSLDPALTATCSDHTTPLSVDPLPTTMH